MFKVKCNDSFKAFSRFIRVFPVIKETERVNNIYDSSVYLRLLWLKIGWNSNIIRKQNNSIC